jgi:hypothetical protein
VLQDGTIDTLPDRYPLCLGFWARWTQSRAPVCKGDSLHFSESLPSNSLRSLLLYKQNPSYASMPNSPFVLPEEGRGDDTSNYLSQGDHAAQTSRVCSPSFAAFLRRRRWQLTPEGRRTLPN